ncbi:prepilin peptidase [Vibrio sp. SCSIO 43140]|uniref:A24 family peptidase n=1 Tax=Vibrio sp. SCSIO 43140 TaxID=2819100 RepID=UPI002075AF0D|nr:prepilin peptidase [Vibrio sp. SCSIO 43140]USD61757.1 prepilin peptidase [Vibrio sp. SCSIO 43140]
MFYLAALACFCVYISVLDIRNRCITNRSVACLFLLQCLLLANNQFYLVSGIVTLAFGLLFFWRKWIAGGDIKLASVLALGLPLGKLTTAVIFTGILGGLLAISYLIIRCWLSDKKQQNSGLPYGVAITSGFYLSILLHQASVSQWI